MKTRCPTAADTFALGVALGRAAFSGAIFCLDGDLGAGKTRLAQGIAAGLGVEGPVVSPTFILVSEYPDARIPLCHADLYRVESAAELRAIGIAERLGEEAVWVVEWAGRFPDLFPEERLDVHLAIDGEARTVTFLAAGSRHQALLATLPGVGP